MDWTIGKRVWGGFITVMVLLAVVMIVTMMRVNDLGELANDKIEGTKNSPSARAIAIRTGVFETLAHLRGWMLLGNPNFKKLRAKSWVAMDNQWLELKKSIPSHWDKKDISGRISETDKLLVEFKKAQAEVEGVANTIDSTPATKILVKQAAPMAKILTTNITRMINIEATLPATVERKALLGMMADVRGSLGLGLANIRAYLLTGESVFRKNFDRFWSITRAASAT